MDALLLFFLFRLGCLLFNRPFRLYLAANGMEDDVDFSDEIAHDPEELKAAAEGAAIRAGDDIPPGPVRSRQPPFT